MSIDNTKLAMLCITAIEVCALMLGIDGALLSTVVAVLAGLGGYSYAKAQRK